jgi:hypothetical protein
VKHSGDAANHHEIDAALDEPAENLIGAKRRPVRH